MPFSHMDFIVKNAWYVEKALTEKVDVLSSRYKLSLHKSCSRQELCNRADIGGRERKFVCRAVQVMHVFVSAEIVYFAAWGQPFEYKRHLLHSYTLR